MVTINDINFKNKKVLIRCDLNVPIKDGIILDDNRIKMSIKTIKYLLKDASKIIIISHLGRIKTKEDLDKNSLKIVCKRLSELLNEEVFFCKYDDNIKKNIDDNKIVMLENTRYFDLDNKKESNNDENLSKYYASLADIFVNDAFGVLHRDCASNSVSKYLPSCIGFLVLEEINKLSELFNPERPFTIIFGGSKVSDKIGIINNLIDKVDNIIIVGGMAFTFLKSKGYNVGNSLIEDDYLDYCKKLLENNEKKILLPIDIYQSDNIDSNSKELVNIENISKMGLDIGPKTIGNIRNVINKSKTIFINGPAGVYENEIFSYGTKELFSILNEMDGKVFIGGGDTASAASKLIKNIKFYHISTGGGASLEFLEGKNLPGLKYIGVQNEKL